MSCLRFCVSLRSKCLALGSVCPTVWVSCFRFRVSKLCADWLRKPDTQTGWGNQIFTRRLAEETRYSRADWLRKPEIYYLLCADWLRKPDIHYADWLIKPDIHYSDYIIFFTIIFFIKRLHKAWIINGWILFEKYYLQDIICGFFNICPLIVANNWDLVI